MTSQRQGTIFYSITSSANFALTHAMDDEDPADLITRFFHGISRETAENVVRLARDGQLTRAAQNAIWVPSELCNAEGK